MNRLGKPPHIGGSQALSEYNSPTEDTQPPFAQQAAPLDARATSTLSSAIPDLRFSHHSRGDFRSVFRPADQDSTFDQERPGLLAAGVANKNALLKRQLSNRERFARPSFYASLSAQELARSPRERWESMMASPTTETHQEASPAESEVEEQEFKPTTQSKHRARRSVSSPMLPQEGLSSPPPLQVIRRVNSISSPGRDTPSSRHQLGQDAASLLSSSGKSTASDPANDIPALIAANGSAEAALQKVITEKKATAARSEQLWRLVEKQRAMILDLNKNLEKALKEKDRYRAKLKETLNNNSFMTRGDITASSDRSASIDMEQAPGTPAQVRQMEDVTQSSPQTPMRQVKAVPAFITRRNDSLADSPASVHHRTDSLISDTGSVTVLEATPVKLSPLTRATATHGARPQTPQMMSPPKLKMAMPNTPPSVEQRGKSKKAPPTPLNLTAITKQEQFPMTESNGFYSDSDYDNSPKTPDQRGRRRTRESTAPDEAQRSSQRKLKAARRLSEDASLVAAQSNSKTRPSQPILSVLPISPRPHLINFASRSTDGNEGSQKMTSQSILAPLVSPGLPLTPRPVDRPLGAPVPRQPRTPLPPRTPAAESLSTAGLPSSPREPVQFLHLPSLGPMDMPTFVEGVSPIEPDSEPLSREISSEQSLHVDEPAVSTSVDRSLASVDRPGLLLLPSALSTIELKIVCADHSSSRNDSPMESKPPTADDFILQVIRKADQKKLWSAQQTMSGMPTLHQTIKSTCSLPAMLPQDTPFANEVKTNVNLRQAALTQYFKVLLDTQLDDTAALVVCRYLSTHVVDANGSASPVPSDEDSAVGMSASGVDGKKKSGFLSMKKSTFGGWKSRYFVLDGPQLKYYNEPAGQLLGTIGLLHARIARQNTDHTPEDYKHAFLILEVKKEGFSSFEKHVLCAVNDEARDSWIGALLPYTIPQRSETPDTAVMQPTTNDYHTRKPSAIQATQQREQRSGTPPSLQALGYDALVAAEAPRIGTPLSHFASQITLDSPSSSSMTLANSSTTAYSPQFEEVALPPIKKRGHSKKRSLFGFRTNKKDDDDDKETSKHSRSLSRHRPTASKVNFSRVVFGAPLAEAAKYFPPQDVDVLLPSPVYRCIEYLEYKVASDEEGLFRLSGASIAIKSLKDRFNHEGDVKLVDGTHHDVHAVASLLKSYLRDLPESVLTQSLHASFLNAVDMPRHQDRVFTIGSLIRRLPEANFELLATLSRFLIGVVNKSDKNKMTTRNISIVFAPTLNVPNELIALFLTEYSTVFNDSAFPSATTTTPPQDYVTNSRPTTPGYSQNNNFLSKQPSANAFQQASNTFQQSSSPPAQRLPPTPAAHISELDGDSVYSSRPTTPFRDGPIESLRSRRPSGKA